MRVSVRKLQRCVRRVLERRALAARRHWVSEIGPTTLEVSLPSCCACCLSRATTSRRELDTRGKRCAIVPYCEACARHAVRPKALRLATVYASALLGFFGGALLAATVQNWGLATILAVSLAALPSLWSRWLNLPRQLAHAARGPAVIWVPRGLACASEPYAHLISQQTGSAPQAESLRAGHLAPSDVVGPLLAIVLTPALNYLFFPVTRVVNLTDRTLVVSVDERVLGRVDPTSGESPAAGEIMRPPSGLHRLRASFVDGTIVSDVQVRIQSGFRHLYAPGARDGCFYLQRVSYGRSEIDGSKTESLYSDSRFWAIPSEVDLWFSPENTVLRGATTGGVVTLLRMGKCR